MPLARPNRRFSTTLYQATDDSQTTLYPNAVPVNVPCYLLLEPKTDKEELVKVTAKSTNSITVDRAQGGTSATDHSIGAALVDFNVPEYFDDLADAYEAVFNDDGTPKEDGTLVTLDGDQELTNKTLTSPVLNGSLTGTGIVDEDDMASDSATKVPTQQSVKKYVDDAVDNISISGKTLNSISQTSLSPTFSSTGNTTEQEVTGLRISLPVIAKTCTVKVTFVGFVSTNNGDNVLRIRVGTSTSYLSNTEYQNAYIGGAKTQETLTMQLANDFDLTSQTYIVISVQNQSQSNSITLSSSNRRTSVIVEVYEPSS